MNYHVVAERTISDLEREVWYYLNRGWKLQGGVSAVIDGSTTLLLQAVIYEEDQES
jgi:hypothetical protein